MLCGVLQYHISYYIILYYDIVSSCIIFHSIIYGISVILNFRHFHLIRILTDLKTRLDPKNPKIYSLTQLCQVFSGNQWKICIVILFMLFLDFFCFVSLAYYLCHLSSPLSSPLLFSPPLVSSPPLLSSTPLPLCPLSSLSLSLTLSLSHPVNLNIFFTLYLFLSLLISSFIDWFIITASLNFFCPVFAVFPFFTVFLTFSS